MAKKLKPNNQLRDVSGELVADCPKCGNRLRFELLRKVIRENISLVEFTLETPTFGCPNCLSHRQYWVLHILRGHLVARKE